MKKLLLIFVFAILLVAQEEKSIFDNALDSASSLWNKTKEVTSKAVDSTSKYGNKAIEKAKEYGGKAWEATKDYSNQGKNIVIEQTLINGINSMLDTKHIKVEFFDINDSTDAISIIVYLDGEDTNLTIDIKEFEWSVSKDKKYIIFEKLDLDINIPWLSYLVDDIRSRENGYLVIEYSASIFSLLYSIKLDIEPTYVVSKKEPFNFLTYEYDKNYFDIQMFKVDNYSIMGLIKLKGVNGSEDFKFYIHDYDLYTANNKKYIFLKNIDFKSTNKPWIKSIIDNQDKSICIDFTWDMYIKLGGIKD